MKPNQLARFAAVILALAGVAALLAAAAVSLRSFEALGGNNQPRRYDCGSVLFAKDPRNLAPAHASVPAAFTRANANCEKIRSDRTRKSLTFMLAGAAPLLFVLTLPALSRRSRRRGRRRRM